MKPSAPPLPPAHPARLILILSLAPTIGLGIGRFAYSLVLPDMRGALGWSYSAAGFMNTINAAGYLAGALLASRLIKRHGLSAAVRWGTIACVVSLALCALSGNFVILSFARLLAGVGAAAGFVAGAALAARIAQSRPQRANFLGLHDLVASPATPDNSAGTLPPGTRNGGEYSPNRWPMGSIIACRDMEKGRPDATLVADSACLTGRGSHRCQDIAALRLVFSIV